jgi:hypothetical protein
VKRLTRVALSGAMFLALTSVSHAKCSGPNFQFKLGQQVSTQRTSDGSPCRFTLNYTGSPIYGTEIVGRPKHGSVSISGRTTVIYSPSAHYKGTDDFAFQWIGKENGTTPNATTINVSVTVQ